jgi:hypothetical protein
MTKTSQINKVVQEYFELNKSVNTIPAKDMMPHFILAGIFLKDNKNGLPIRTILRRLDDKNQLHLISHVLAERKEANTNWFFQRNGSTALTSQKTVEKPKTTTTEKSNSRKDSDEHYVLNLCDAVIGKIGLRQHKFDFLLGDTNAKGKQAKLPVDIYYPELNLVIEYKEQQHTKPNKHFDKPDLFTVSGVHRGEQRRIYDQRRLAILPQNGIQIIEISYSDFMFDRRDRIVRDEERDLEKVRGILEEKIK